MSVRLLAFRTPRLADTTHRPLDGE